MATKQRGGKCPCQRGGEIPNFLQNTLDNIPSLKHPSAITSNSANTAGVFNGGYRATKRDKFYLKKYRRGQSIGFTMKASLKAKGLLPRNSKTMRGKRIVSNKYR